MSAPATISDGTNTESDIYDAGGNILLQTDSATGSTLFNGADTLHEAAGSSTVTGDRIYSLDGITVAVRSTAAGVSGSVLTWQVADAQNTVNLEVDAVAGTVSYRAQDPFGNSRGSAATWIDDRGYLDAPTSTFSGLTQLGARFYDPTIGKFLSVDPVLTVNNPQQVNGYSYAQNDPVSHSDPTGLLTGMQRICEVPQNQCGKYAPKTGSTSSGSSGGGSGGSNDSGASDILPPGVYPYTQALAYQAGLPLNMMFRDRLIPASILHKVFGFTQDSNGILHTEADPLQLKGNYMEFYDQAFKVGAANTPKIFPFQVGHTSYVIWVWKGNYPVTGDGGEIAMYSQNKPLADVQPGSTWFSSYGSKNIPTTSETVTDNGVTVESSGAGRTEVWDGGWSPYAHYPNSALTLTATVTFPTHSMYSAFVNSPGVLGDHQWAPDPTTDSDTITY